jgi:hypothetical protein
MNSMNDQRFFDLAMKAIGRHGSEAERAELDALLAKQPELKAVWEQLQADARLAREVAPLVAATQSSSGEFPAYARERLQTKVRRTLGASAPTNSPRRWHWRWLAGLAAASAAVVLLVLPSLRSTSPVVEVAMLDTTGVVRGSDTNDVEVLRRHWPASSVNTFNATNALAVWKREWPSGDKRAAKVLYDRAAGEVQVFVRGANMPMVFVVERNLAATLREVDKFIRQRASGN